MRVKYGAMSVAALVGFAGLCAGRDPEPATPTPLIQPQDPPKLELGPPDNSTIDKNKKPQVDLTPRHVAGQVRMYKMSQRSVSTNHDAGPPPKETRTQFAHEAVFKIKCVDATPGAVKYELVFERFRVQATGAGKYDSLLEKDQGQSEFLRDIYKPLIGPVILLELDEENRIRKATGGESLGSGETAERTREVVTAASLRQTVGHIFNGHRATGLKDLQQVWQVEEKTSFDLGRFVLTTDFGVVSTTDETGEIDFRGSLKEEQMEGRGPSKLKLRNSGVVGKLSWDARNGWMNKFYLEQLYDVDAQAEKRDVWSTTQSQLLIDLSDPKPRLRPPASKTPPPPPPPASEGEKPAEPPNGEGK